MRRTTLLPLAALAQHALSQSYQYDYRTTSDCISWVDITDPETQTCESTLREWSLEPKRFHIWNPSVGLNCKPWFKATSYCVLTNASLEDSVFYTTMSISDYPPGLPLASLTTDSDGWTIPVTRSDAPARTTSTPAPIPSPATWKDMGCFVDTWNDDYDIPPSEWKWILDFRFVPKDPAETLDKCKTKCWEIAYPVAGVKAGTECFCGARNNGTLAADQNECNTPCGGDKSVICGGTNRTTVWEAEGYVQSSSGAPASTGSGSGSPAGSVQSTGASASAATATASSGARRNAAMFWRM